MPIFDEAIFRQRERTIDNIKRVYAVVYSISLTNILGDIFAFTRDWFTQQAAGTTYKQLVAGLQLRLLMLVIFLLTVSVFAYQADKFLDLRYTLRPSGKVAMPTWSRRGFAIDVGTLILTLIPFTMMAYAFDNSLVNRYGSTPFFFSYLLLLAISVVLLFLLRISYLAALDKWSGSGSPDPNVNQIAIHEERRYAILSVHWFIIDGVAVLLATGLYYTLTVFGGPLCGVSMHSPALWFILGFTLIAAIRSVTDYVAAWPFFYHNERTLIPDQLGPILKRVAHSPMEARPTWWDLTGVGASIVVLGAGLGLIWYPGIGTAVCPKP